MSIYLVNFNILNLLLYVNILSVVVHEQDNALVASFL